MTQGELEQIPIPFQRHMSELAKPDHGRFDQTAADEPGNNVNGRLAD